MLAAAEIERILLRLEFVFRPGKGAHRFYRHSDGRTTPVPFHAGRDISPVLLRKIAAILPCLSRHSSNAAEAARPRSVARPVRTDKVIE